MGRERCNYVALRRIVAATSSCLAGVTAGTLDKALYHRESYGGGVLDIDVATASVSSAITYRAPFDFYKTTIENVPMMERGAPDASCWITAFLKVDHDLEQSPEPQPGTSVFPLTETSGESACASMTDHQRRILALEMTRCFMRQSAPLTIPLSFPVGRSELELELDPDVDLDLDLEQEETRLKDSTVRGRKRSETNHKYAFVNCDDSQILLRNPKALGQCLGRLDDHAYNQYTYFLGTVESVCTQLSRERWRAALATWSREAARRMDEIGRDQKAVLQSMDEIARRAVSIESSVEEVRRTILDEQKRMLDIFDEVSDVDLVVLNRLLESSFLESEKIYRSVDTATEFLRRAMTTIGMALPWLSFLLSVNLLWILTATRRTRRARPYLLAIASVRMGFGCLTQALVRARQIDEETKHNILLRTTTGCYFLIPLVIFLAALYRPSLSPSSRASMQDLTLVKTELKRQLQQQEHLDEQLLWMAHMKLTSDIVTE